MAEISYELAHIGLNNENQSEAAAVASLFAQIFNLPVRDGPNSVYAGNAVEAMKKPGKGRFGHIGMGTPDCEAAVKDLESRGFEVDMSTAKYRPDGTLNVVYLKQEIGGFAVHIVRKP